MTIATPVIERDQHAAKGVWKGGQWDVFTTVKGGEGRCGVIYGI